MLVSVCSDLVGAKEIIETVEVLQITDREAVSSELGVEKHLLLDRSKELAWPALHEKREVLGRVFYRRKTGSSNQIAVFEYLGAAHTAEDGPHPTASASALLSLNVREVYTAGKAAHS